MTFGDYKFGDFGRREEPDDEFTKLQKRIQEQMDKANEMVKNIDVMIQPEKKTTPKYNWWKDDLYVPRTTTTWAPLEWPPITHTESSDRFLADYNKKVAHNDDFFKHTQVHTPHHTFSYVWIPIVSLLPMVFLVILAIFLVRRRNKWTPAAAVLPNGRVIGPGPTVQGNQQIPMLPPRLPPGQGGADPPNMPYSDNFNRPYNDNPPPYPTDADLQVQPNSIGFRNEIAAAPSAPPPPYPGDGPIESLNYGLNKENAGQGTRNADEKESVKYVDEKSSHK